jgi:hypothetical protein
MNESMNKKLTNSQKPGDTRQLLEPVHPTKRQKWTTYLIGFALGITAVALGIFLYWGFSGKDALDVHNAPLPVQPVVVKSAEKITVTIDFCKLTHAQGTIYLRFVSDRTELVVPTQEENLPAKCYHNFPFQVPIPPQTTPGTYHLNYRVDYKTNPLTTVREEFNSREFKVVE